MSQGAVGRWLLGALAWGVALLGACGEDTSSEVGTATTSTTSASAGAGAGPACEDGRACLDLDTIQFCNDGTEVVLGCDEICSAPGEYALGCAFDPGEGRDFCFCDTAACAADDRACANADTALLCDGEGRFAFRDCSDESCTFGTPGCRADTLACGCVGACDACLAACEGQADCCGGCGCACEEACGSSC